MEEKRLIDPLTEVIPINGGGPTWTPIWQRVWQRVTSWFYNAVEGGVYDTRADKTHYDRWWWSWHLISDPSEIMGDFAGWAGRVYDYFEDWIAAAREQLSEKVGHIQWTIRPWEEGGIWDHLFDTFDRFKDSFASFRDNPADFIYACLPQWIKDLWSLWDNAWTWLWNHFVQWFKDAVSLVNTWYTQISNFFSNLYTIVVDFLSRIWDWLWEHFQQWFKDAVNLVHTWRTQIGNFFTNLYTTITDFLSRVWAWIYEHIPQEFKDIWNNAKTWWDWLNLRWDDFTREVGAFINDPYGYLTGKLQAWIEGWRDYIFQEVKELVLTHQNYITNGLVRLVILLCPVKSTGSPPLYEYTDLDTFIEGMRWWIEGDGAKEKYGYDEIVKWTRKNVLLEKD